MLVHFNRDSPCKYDMQEAFLNKNRIAILANYPLEIRLMFVFCGQLEHLLLVLLSVNNAVGRCDFAILLFV